MTDQRSEGSRLLVSVRIPPELWRAARIQGIRIDRPVAEVVEIALREYLERLGVEVEVSAMTADPAEIERLRAERAAAAEASA